MAQLLYRLGRFSARRAWIVIVGWVVMLGIAGGAFAAFGGTLTSSVSIPGTATDQVNTRLSEALPDLTGASASVVFRADPGALTAEQQDAIHTLLGQISEVDGVVGVSDPFATELSRQDQRQKIEEGQKQLSDARAQLQSASAQTEADFESQSKQLADAGIILDASTDLRTVSEDGATAIASIGFEEDMFNLPLSVREAVADRLDSARIDGVEVAYSSTITSEMGGLLGVGEIVGVGLAAIVLIIMMRALLPAIAPLLSSVVGVGIGIAGSLAFSGSFEMASITPVLGVMLGLAVGIDYSLFILNRHRNQLRAGVDVAESIGLANGTSGTAVVFAGFTVIIALVALLITGIPFLGVMGVVGAACVLIAVLVSISFTPAVLSLMKLRVLNRKARASHRAPSQPDTEVRPLRTGRAIASAALATLALGIIALPAASMQLGLPTGASEAPESPQYRAYATVEEEFGPGMNGPLVVVAEMDEPVESSADQLDRQARIIETISEHDVAGVAPIAISDDQRTFVFQVVPTDGPASESTTELVEELRSLPAVDGGGKLGVAGQASGNIDVSQMLAAALPGYLLVVIGLSLLIMIVVFRSLLVPILATGGYVLSLFAALGTVTAVYQWGWLGWLFAVHDPEPVISFAPIIITGVLFGLAMDYQLFLVTGMREAYVHGQPARRAVVTGLRHGRVVVIAAAIIMAAVFGGFIFSHLPMVRPFGLGLAAGVLFDAFVVRLLIVPSVMHLLGEKAWWLPRWLDRIIPKVDVEGSSLERSHPAARLS